MTKSEKQMAVHPDAVRNYRQRSIIKWIIIGSVIVLIVLLSLFALHAGAAEISFYDMIKALTGATDEKANLVIWKIRLPRILAALVAGMGLAVSGCIMQTTLRNPLASPSTLGISNAAAFGANVAIVFFASGSYRSSMSDAVTIVNPYSTTMVAFVFSIAAMMSILFLARLKGFSSESIVLAGVAFGSLFSAGSTLLQYFAEDTQIAAMVFWTFGDLGRVAWQELFILVILVGGACLFFLWHRWDYNALESGEEAAVSLGVNVESLRFWSMFFASLITAVSVAFLGIIGFVGLIAPQMMRRIIGVDHCFLILASALTGSALLLIADTLARTLISPVILPVGAITSFFGAPLFLFLLAKGYKKR